MATARAFRAFFNIVADALFPVHRAEQEVLSLNGPAAYSSLPRAVRVPIAEACSLFSYKDERVSRLIWSIKYRRSRAGAAIAGYALYRMLRFFVAALPPDTCLLVVPMPITKARRRERGFNQCELILDEVKKLDQSCPLGIQAGPNVLFAPDLLLRVRHTSRQTLKDRQERLESIHGIFAVNERAVVLAELQKNPPGYFIVIIDDVITTGSTMKDAVDTLRQAGFANAWGLSVAH